MCLLWIDVYKFSVPDPILSFLLSLTNNMFHQSSSVLVLLFIYCLIVSGTSEKSTGSRLWQTDAMAADALTVIPSQQAC